MALPPRPDGLSPRVDTQNINIQLPRWLVAEVRLLLINPRTGKVAQRGWSRVYQEALELWLERQKVSLDA